MKVAGLKISASFSKVERQYRPLTIFASAWSMIAPRSTTISTVGHHKGGRSRSPHTLGASAAASAPSLGATSGGIGNNAPSWRKQMQTEINAKVPTIRIRVLSTFTRCCSRPVIIFPHRHVARSPSRSLPSSSPHHLRNIATQHPTSAAIRLIP